MYYIPEMPSSAAFVHKKFESLRSEGVDDILRDK